MHDLTPSVSEWVLIILTCIAIFGLGNVARIGRTLARLHRWLHTLPPSAAKPSDGSNHDRHDQPQP